MRYFFANIEIDTRGVDMLEKSLARLPDRLAKQALQRTLGRSRDRVKREYARRVAARMKISQKLVLALTNMRHEGEGLSLSVRSQWISLTKMGAQQRRYGVYVPKRRNPELRGAFIASMRNKHRGVFARDSSASLPISEFYGPNPAWDIRSNPDVYQEQLQDFYDEAFMDELEKQIGQAIGRLPSGA